jgi:ABC-2 type transport system ATP-binding protein
MIKEVLKVLDVCKSFDDKVILNKVSFCVKSGEIFGFVGLNGAGKTSLIKIILDLLDEDEGLVEIFGINKLLPKSRQKICYLPEKFHPSSNLKGREFVKFVLDFYNQKLDEVELKRLCQNLDLPYDVLNKKATKYSKGMTQKLGLISVFMSQADLIILDEPMSGLDPKARIQLKKQILDYQKQGKTIFFSSHILSDMDEICDHIAVLNNKEIVFDGSPVEFKEKHQKESLDAAFLKEIGVFV